MNDVTHVVDQLLLQNAELTARLIVLNEMVLGVHGSKLSKEEYEALITNFYEKLHSRTQATFVQLEQADVLYRPVVLLPYLKELLEAIDHEAAVYGVQR
jgi:hypothetical protein